MWPVSCISLLCSSECEQESHWSPKPRRWNWRSISLAVGAENLDIYRKVNLRWQHHSMILQLNTMDQSMSIQLNSFHLPKRIPISRLLVRTSTSFLLKPEQDPNMGWEMADKGKTTTWTCHQCSWSASRLWEHSLSPFDLHIGVQWW